MGGVFIINKERKKLPILRKWEGKREKKRSRKVEVL
jgi:hypothetical protein